MTKTKQKPIDYLTAKKEGFTSITRGFAVDEQDLLHSALSTMEGKVEYRLVLIDGHIEIWRKKAELLDV